MTLGFPLRGMRCGELAKAPPRHAAHLRRGAQPTAIFGFAKVASSLEIGFIVVGSRSVGECIGLLSRAHRPLPTVRPTESRKVSWREETEDDLLAEVSGAARTAMGAMRACALHNLQQSAASRPFGSSAPCRPRSSRKASANLAHEGRFDYLLVESTGVLEPLPAAETRLGRRTALTFPLFPPPQKN